MPDKSPGLEHRHNRLLAAISPATFGLLERDLQHGAFEQGSVLLEPGDAVERVYFPQTGMISLLVVTKDGQGIEAATIGREGGVGLHRGNGKRRAFTRAVTQVGGTFSYIRADRFEHAAKQNGEINDLISRYTEVLWVEAQQIAACNAIHNAEARLCRWLLQTMDRIESDTVPLTQEFLSQMLGVRRTTVTMLAQALQMKNVIQYRRGKIVVTNRGHLEDCACECYHVIQHEKLPLRVGIDF